MLGKILLVFTQLFGGKNIGTEKLAMTKIINFLKFHAEVNYSVKNTCCKVNCAIENGII